MQILKKNNIILFIIFLIIGFLLRYINNFDQMYWLDEAYTLYLSDPLIPLKELPKKIYNIDDNPIIYFYILRFFNYFNYTPENIRFSSIIFGTLSILLSLQFYKNFLKKEENFYTFLLLTFNIFLIWQSKEARISSSVLFFSLLNLICFFNYLKKDKKIYSIQLFLINIFVLSYYPFLITIILSQIIFIILNLKKKYFEYFFITVATIIFYIFFNYDYLLSNISKENHIGSFEYKFFINYFFRSFFGSILLGGITLIIFAYGFIKIILENKKDDLLYFNILLIIISYSFVIFYSYFKVGIMVPRYFIFLIPSIILIIVKIIYEHKILRYFYLCMTILNTFIIFDDFKIKKPKLSYLFSNIDVALTKNFFVNEGKMLDNYFIKSNLITNKLKYIKKNNLNNVNSFFFICLNHAEMHVGKNKQIQDEKKCNITFNNFNAKSTKEIKDFKIVFFEKI